MIAYNRTWLDALRIRDIAGEWHTQGLFDDEKWKLIQERHPSNFYSPNVFVRIGLAFFSLILLTAAIGLFALFFGADSDDGFGALSIFFGALALLMLEFWSIRSARHFGSGVDDMLLYFGVGCIITGLCAPLPYDAGQLTYYCIAWPFLVAGSVRYLDRAMTAAAYVCSLLILLSFVERAPNLAVYLLPFSGILFSAAVYLLARRGQGNHALRHWHKQLGLLELLALVTLYLSGNYWVVQQAALDMYQLERIPLGWFFWAFTFGVPAALIFAGIQQKDRLLLDVGLGTVAGAIFTFRYYFHVLPWEWAAVAGGAILFATAYFSIRYLRANEGAYTYEAHGDATLLQEIEEQLIEQTIASQSPPVPVKKEGFDGGQFGGGGAGAEF